MYEGKCYTILPFMTYDGTNGAAIFAASSDGQDGTWSYNEDDDILTIRADYDEVNYEEWAAPIGGSFMIRPNGGVAQGMTAEFFNSNYAVVVEATNPPVLNATGIDDVPTLAAGASTTISVEVKPAFADDAYVAVAQIIGGKSLLGKLEVTSATVVDESTVSVVVHNTDILLSVSGGKVLVNAVK